MLMPFLGYAQKIATDTSTQAHIESIEKGLYPIYNIRGQEKPKTIPQMMHEKKVVGLSMAFVDHGKVTWTKCYGYSDLKDSVSITPNTIFRAASLSKPVTAMAALHFVEAGKLELDQDINQKLKGWKVPENEFTKEQKVTVAKIIGHRSGIKNDIHQGIPPGEKIPSLEDIFSGRTVYAPVQVISVPGEKTKYSNVGYMVLSELLSDVNEKEFPVLMEETVLKPCEMMSSTFDQELPAAFRERIATGHDENMQAIPYYRHASYGAGGLWSTPADLGKFLAEILGAYHDSSKKGKIISHEMARKVFEEKREKLGFNKNYRKGNFVFRNDGSIPGYTCILMGSLTNNQAVVLMLNTGSDEAYDFLNFLWRSVSMEYDWKLYEPEFYTAVDLPKEKLMAYEGHFMNQDDSIGLTMNEGYLVFDSRKTGKRKLVPVGNTSFVIPDIPMKLDFDLDSDGKVKKLYIRDQIGNEQSPYSAY